MCGSALSRGVFLHVLFVFGVTRRHLASLSPADMAEVNTMANNFSHIHEHLDGPLSLVVTIMLFSLISFARGYLKKSLPQKAISSVFLAICTVLLFGTDYDYYEGLKDEGADNNKWMIIWFIFGICGFFASVSTCYFAKAPEKTAALMAVGLMSATSCHMALLIAHEPQRA